MKRARVLLLPIVLGLVAITGEAQHHGSGHRDEQREFSVEEIVPMKRPVPLSEDVMQAIRADNIVLKVTSAAFLIETHRGFREARSWRLRRARRAAGVWNGKGGANGASKGGAKEQETRRQASRV